MRAALSEFHKEQPLLTGQNASQLRLQLKLDELGFEKLQARLIAEKVLVKDGNLLRLASHEIQFSEEEETAKQTLEKLFLAAGINTPSLKELMTGSSGAPLSEYPPELIESTFFALLNLGQFIRVNDTFFIHKTVFEEIVVLLTDYLHKHDMISVSEFRELAQTSRKYAVPFLEACDGRSITVRDGNVRRLHPRLQR